MTLLINRPSKRNGVSVLIVAVGHYEGSLLAPLPGVASTAKRLSSWWTNANATDRLLGGIIVSRLDVLVSDSVPVQLKDENGRQLQVSSARCDAVHQAIQDWREHSRTASLAVLHWIGHGEFLGEGGNAPIHRLACEDALPGGKMIRSIVWQETLDALRLTLDQPELLFFVDTCRCVKDGLLGSTRRVFNEDVPAAKPKDVMLFYSCDVGDRTYCVKPGLPVEDAFEDGGSLYSEVVLQALDRFGAAENNAEIGPAVYAPYLQAFFKPRLERWRRRVKELESRSFSPVFEAKGDLWNPLLRAPAPQSMVELRLSDKSGLSEAECVITGNGRTIEPFKGKDVWDVDLPWGDWKAEVSFKWIKSNGPHVIQPVVPKFPHVKNSVRLPSRDEG